MNWLKQNLVVLACSAAFVALLGLTGWQIQKGYGRRKEIEAELQAKQDEIEKLRGAKIFPAKENFEALRKDRLQLLQIYSNMQVKVSHSLITPPTIKRDVDFGLFLGATQTALRTAAGSNTNLENFAFGFNRYKENFPCRSVGLHGGDCERLLTMLAKEIIVVDKIVRLLFESGTDAVLDIQRTQIAPEPAGIDTIPWNVPANPKALYTTMPFQFKFACDKTQTLQKFLNKLAESDLFFEVRTLIVDTEPYAVGAPPGPVTPFSQPGRTVPETMQAEAKYRLVVTARIDLVEFACATNAAPAAASATTK